MERNMTVITIDPDTGEKDTGHVSFDTERGSAHIIIEEASGRSVMYCFDAPDGIAKLEQAIGIRLV